MSDDLKAFLTAWLAWAEAGAPDSNRHTRANLCRFDAECGLCSNTYNFEEAALGIDSRDTGKLEDELHELLCEDNLSIGYPFGGDERYNYEANNLIHHKNEARLAWVRSKLSQPERTCAT